jgi:rhodanese-related sulfurtransferase
MFARLMGLKTVSPAALHELMQRETVAVMDVNSDQSWSKAHVPGARRLDAAGYSAGDLPSDKDSLVVFYCSNLVCRKAPNAALRAKGMGYTNVRVMSAGISGWLNAKLPTESATPPRGSEA